MSGRFWKERCDKWVLCRAWGERVMMGVKRSVPRWGLGSGGGIGFVYVAVKEPKCAQRYCWPWGPPARELPVV